ncbi:MAG: biotin carboxylase N-terminal domain-containing protein [Nitrolancea sp.]
MSMRVAIANRAEIAIRIAATCRLRGLQPVLVCGAPDSDGYAARTIGLVEVAGPSGAEIDPEAVIAAAKRAGCTYLHPGYGFLSERPTLARACAEAGITFIGPSAETLEHCGDKVATRAIAESAGVPLLQASETLRDDQDEWRSEAERIGYPILVKAVLGGGGASLRPVASTDELIDAIESARREAEAAGAGPMLYLERYLPGARHIEVQVAGDGERSIAIGERECSLQRRHQKVIEEAPAVNLPEADRQRLFDYAMQVAEAVRLKSLATVEFLYGTDGTIAFIEVNPRLQVEHPVTELVTGIDLVALQLDIANGLPLPGIDQTTNGHAIEARLYAEDPAKHFLPSPGPIRVLSLPAAPNIRIDAGYQAGDRIPERYDPMIAKIIARGDSREVAIDRLHDSLWQASVAGVATNRPWLLALLDDERVRDGRYDTRTAQSIPTPSSGEGLPLLIAAALVAMTLERPPSNDPWERIGPFRMSGASELAFHDPNGDWELVASVEQVAGEWQVTLGERYGLLSWRKGPDDVWSIAFADWAGRVAIWRESNGVIELTSSHGRWFARAGRRSVESTRTAREADNNIRAPLPGKVIRVDAEPDGIVPEGEPLVILSAMKIEIVLRAPKRSRVTAVHCHPDEQVDAGDLLVEIAPEEES